MAPRLGFSRRTLIAGATVLVVMAGLYWWTHRPLTWDGTMEFTVTAARDDIVQISSIEGTALGDGEPFWGDQRVEGISLTRARHEVPFSVGTRVSCQVHQRIDDEYSRFSGLPDIHVGHCTTNPAVWVVTP